MKIVEDQSRYKGEGCSTSQNGSGVSSVSSVKAGKYSTEVVTSSWSLTLQLIVNHEYDINITIYDADNHVIHPSENILTKTTFGKQFDVIAISVRKLCKKLIPISMPSLR